MIVSQLKLLQDELGMRATLLLDDPAAELDEKNLQRLFAELSSLEVPDDRDLVDARNRAFSST